VVNVVILTRFWELEVEEHGRVPRGALGTGWSKRLRQSERTSGKCLARTA
jgi:hypothetical protein